MIRKVTILILSIFFCIIALTVSFAEEDLRTQLEGAYKAILEASSLGNKEDFKVKMSAYSYRIWENNLMSMQCQIDKDLIEGLSKSNININDMQFINVYHKGPTAALVYVVAGELNGAMDAPEVKFIVIRFIFEDDEWKYDKLGAFYRAKYQEDGSETRFNESDLSEDFAIDGKVFSVPPLKTMPELTGLISIFSYGYRTNVIINGIKQKSVDGRSSCGWIDGGLKLGKNEIKILFKRKKDPCRMTPHVIIKLINQNKPAWEGDPRENPNNVFCFEPEGKVKRKYIATFTINKEDIERIEELE